MEAGKCITHFDTERLCTLRSYARIFNKEKTDTKAKLIYLLEQLTNTAHADWIDASYKWFVEQFFGYISEETVKKHLDELIKEDWVRRRPSPTYGPPLYRLNCPKIQAELCRQREQIEGI